MALTGAVLEPDQGAVVRMRRDLQTVVREARALRRILQYANGKLILDGRDFDHVAEAVRFAPPNTEGAA
jgi:hypothetical protein